MIGFDERKKSFREIGIFQICLLLFFSFFRLNLRASLLVGPLCRDLLDVVDTGDDVCGEGPNASDAKHTVADLEVPRVSSNLFNLTGELKTWHELSLGSKLVKTKNREHLKRNKES